MRRCCEALRRVEYCADVSTATPSVIDGEANRVRLALLAWRTDGQNEIKQSLEESAGLLDRRHMRAVCKPHQIFRRCLKRFDPLFHKSYRTQGVMLAVKDKHRDVEAPDGPEVEVNQPSRHRLHRESGRLMAGLEIGHSVVWAQDFALHPKGQAVAIVGRRAEEAVPLAEKHRSDGSERTIAGIAAQTFQFMDRFSVAEPPSAERPR